MEEQVRRSRWPWLAGAIVVVIGLALAYALIRGSQPSEGDLTVPTFSFAPSPSEIARASRSPTASATPRPEELLAAGDIGACDRQADDAVARLAAELPGQIALLGDIAYQHGSAQEFADCFDPPWGPLRDRLRPVPGNHEYETAGASGYFDYFGADAGTAGDGWYSYDVGTWHVIALNSECGVVGCDPGSAQFRWLTSDLRDHPAACTLAYWHHPRYSSGLHGDQTSTEPLWRALVNADADVILNGHDHSYERQLHGDVREFVVGTGGRSLYAFDQEPSAATEERNNTVYGLLWLTLREGGYDWRFVSLGSSGYADTGTGDCH
jgi:hypothetical protein